MLRLLAGLIVVFWTATAAACPGVDAPPCAVADGEYCVVLPEVGDAPPVLIFLHGYNGDAADVLRAGFASTFLARGYAAVAPQGLPLGPNRGTNWAVDDGREHARDDVAFLSAVLNDAAARFGFNRGRVLMAGFSRGGSMVWDVACTAPDTAAAYAPVAGGFWRPYPSGCAAPVRLLHTHGFSDTTVPLEGRLLRGGPAEQGDIYEGLKLWRKIDGCGARASRHDTREPFWRKDWTDCAAGDLAFALHSGGHGVPEAWAEMALEWFEAPPRAGRG